MRLVIAMITARQIRAARALLSWSQQDLADRAVLSLNAIVRLETGKADTRVSTLTSVQKALVGAGIEFLPAGMKGEGVRLRDPAA